MILQAPYEDNELISLLQQRDHHAFKFLYDKYSPAIYSVILQIVGDKEITNGLVQDVFVFVWRKIESYDPVKERLFTWLLKMARHLALEETRTPFTHSRSVGSGSIPNPDLLYTNHSEVAECGLKKLFKKLNEESMMVIDLCYFKNLTDDQIAEKLSIPPDKVKSRIRVALSELRTMLT